MKKNMSDFSYEVLNLMPHLLRGMVRKHKDDLTEGLLTLPQFLALDLIDREEGMKMKDIAQQLNISLPAATGMMDRLYHYGMIKREADTNDRRIVKIVLTDKGRKTLNNTRDARRKAIEDVFGKLSQKEREEYLNILRKIKKILYGKKENL